VLIVGILIYLFRIADRHSVIITLAGIKFFAVILLGFFIFIIANFSVLYSEILGFEFVFRNIILRVLIYILIFTLITIILDIVPLREMVYYFVKKVKKEKVAIKIGKGHIIELEKQESKIIYIINQIIGYMQLFSVIIITSVVLAMFWNLISITSIEVENFKFSQEAAEYLFISLLLLFGFCLAFSGISWLYYNRESKKIGL
jgi:hypothetical protein